MKRRDWIYDIHEAAETSTAGTHSYVCALFEFLTPCGSFRSTSYLTVPVYLIPRTRSHTHIHAHTLTGERANVVVVVVVTAAAAAAAAAATAVAPTDTVPS
jgi:hypothetical protein